MPRYPDGIGYGQTLVTGASDDLIELDGDIYDEIGHYDSEPARLEFDNGVVLDIVFAKPGTWRITVIAGHDRVTHTPYLGESDDADEVGTDRAVVHGAITMRCKGYQYSAR